MPEPTPEPPGQVTGVKVADVGQDFVSWTWNAVEGATGYEAVPYLSSNPDGERETFFVTEPSVRMDGFEPGTKISIHVRAVRETAGGRAVGPWSNRVHAETLLPKPAPNVEAIVWLYKGSADGYLMGEKIRVVVEFEQRLSVEGSPRLAIEIGDHVRLADFSPWIEDDFPPERPSFLQRFDYEVLSDDEDADGISIHSDALDFSEGAFLNSAGVKIEVEITAVAAERDSPNPVEPGEALDTHRVLGLPEPRVCTNERRQALRYDAVLVREWDGTPFQFYWDASIPDREKADAEHFFDVVERLSDRVEEQIGYSILEVAGWIEEDERGFRISHTDIRQCTRPQPGRIVATVVPEVIPSSGLVIAKARPRCGVLYWTSNDVDTTLDGVMAHEIWHLFGFQHNPLSTHPNKSPRGVGYPMSIHLTNQYTDPRELGPNFHDIDALRCIFPRR